MLLGNWATDTAAGSAYSNRLLFVVLFASLLAMFLQGLATRLGLVARKDLAQVCRSQFHPWLNRFLWISAGIAIAACDLGTKNFYI